MEGGGRRTSAFCVLSDLSIQCFYFDRMFGDIGEIYRELTTGAFSLGRFTFSPRLSLLRISLTRLNVKNLLYSIAQRYLSYYHTQYNNMFDRRM